jgi:protein TonB
MMPEHGRRRLLRMLPTLAVLVMLLLAGGLVYVLKTWLADNQPESRKIVQQVTILTPPPPPPPPEEQPPEPEVEEEIEPEPDEVVEETPENAEPPAGSDLGVDADGAGAGDGFGLIGKKGGRSLLDGSPFAWYEGLMVSELQDVLSNIDALKSVEYDLRIKLKLGFDGSVERIVLVSTTGDRKKDEMLLSALHEFTRFSRMPPGKMPPVVTLKITSTI